MSFEALPRELQLIIVSEYLSPELDERDSLDSPAPHPLQINLDIFDLKLALDLAVVSPSCRDIVSGILLRRVRITRPSSLRSLFTLLARRPDLAAHVKSIHLGPDKEPDSIWYRWPIAGAGYGWPNLGLRSTLDEITDAARVPAWYSRDTIWHDLDRNGKCTTHAVSNAIEAAIEGLDVEPWRKGYSKSGLHIGIRAWTSRLFLLVAALDVYILHMREVEDVCSYDHPSFSQWLRLWPQECIQNTCGHEYPRYQILFEPSMLPAEIVSNDGHEVFTVTEAQLWKHLERRHGPADNFDHATIFTSSTRLGLDIGEEQWKRMRDELHGPGAPQVYTDTHWRQIMGYDPYKELDRVYDPLEKLPSGRSRYEEASQEEKEAGRQRPLSPSSDKSEGYPNGRTVQERANRAEDLLALAGYIFSLMSQVTNISVTGLFFRALPALRTQSVRSLIIGPRARYWDDVLPPDLTSLKNLVRLRIVGMMSSSDATKIPRQLQHLRHLEWEVTDQESPNQSRISLPNPLVPLDVNSVYKVIWTLRGAHVPISSEAEQQKTLLGKRTRRDSESSSDGIGDQTARNTALQPSPPAPHPAFPSHNPQRTTLVLLRHEVASKVWNKSRTEQGLSLWGEGRVVEGQYPVKVGVSNAVVLPSSNWEESYGIEMRALYKRSREWWDEGHTGAGAAAERDAGD